MKVSKTISIESSVLTRFEQLCKENEVQVNHVLEQIVLDYNMKNDLKKENLPDMLKCECGSEQSVVLGIKCLKCGVEIASNNG